MVIGSGKRCVSCGEFLGDDIVCMFDFNGVWGDACHPCFVRKHFKDSEHTPQSDDSQTDPSEGNKDTSGEQHDPKEG